MSAVTMVSAHLAEWGNGEKADAQAAEMFIEQAVRPLDFDAKAIKDRFKLLKVSLKGTKEISTRRTGQHKRLKRDRPHPQSRSMPHRRPLPSRPPPSPPQSPQPPPPPVMSPAIGALAPVVVGTATARRASPQQPTR